MQYCKKTKKTTQYTRLKASQYTKQKRLGLHYTVRKYLSDTASDVANRHVQTMYIIIVAGFGQREREREREKSTGWGNYSSSLVDPGVVRRVKLAGLVVRQWSSFLVVCHAAGGQRTAVPSAVARRTIESSRRRPLRAVRSVG